MKFAYTYRSSDGQRHTAEIEAESRDAAFAKVRAELGIKPIKVTAAGPEDGSRQDGASPKMATKGGAGRAANVSAAPRGGTWKAAILAAMALAAAAYAYWLKANAQLQAMGIYPLALPDALRSYQMGLDIEE